MNVFIKSTLILIVGLLISGIPINANEKTFQVEKKKLVDGVIWGLDFINEQELIFTTRSGVLYRYHLKSEKLTKIKHSIEVFQNGQGGLLDIMIDKSSLYLTYSKKINDSAFTTALYKGELKKDKLIGSDIFIAKTDSDETEHFGSRVIKVNNSLYMSVGDRGMRDKAQDYKNHHGVMIRLNMDGSAHKDNPFKESPYVYSFGHRNPQGLAFDSSSKVLYEAEFGPRGGDEVNIIEKGKNYGWPVITYGSEYWGPKIGKKKQKGMEQPLVYWTPSISPSGLMFYNNDHFSKWKGDLFLANLSSTHLRRVHLKAGKVVEQESLLEDLEMRLRVIKAHANGHIYIGTDSGHLLHLY